MPQDRIPPHSDEAERSVLGACMLSRDALYDCMEQTRPQDFYNKNHGEIFEAMLKLDAAGRPVDALTVSEELAKRNSLEIVGGRAYVAELSANVPSTSNAGDYAKIVAEKAELRMLIDTAGDILTRGDSDEMDTRDILEYAERSIFDIAKERQRKDLLPIKEDLEDNLRQINERAEHKGQLLGVPTGLTDLDNMLSGMQKSNLIILAARPAMGKTAFSLCVARNAAVQGKKVAIFNLEMAATELSQRLIAMESRVEAKKLKEGNLEPEDWKKMSAAVDTLGNASIYIDENPGVKVSEIKNKCRRLQAEQGLDLIIVDYLQLMTGEGRAESRQLEVSALSREFKLLARELDCPVLLLSQLSRQPETRTDHRPQLSDLRESGSIEQDADVVIFLYRDEVYNEETETPGECEVIIAKHRNGEIGKVNVIWQSRYTRFANKSF